MIINNALQFIVFNVCYVMAINFILVLMKVLALKIVQVYFYFYINFIFKILKNKKMN